MKSKFRCERCGTETTVGEGLVSLVCQSCGCFDIVFLSDILVAPANPGEDVPPSLVKANDPFLGTTKKGCVWNITFPKEEKPVEPVPPPVLAKPLKVRRK